MATATLFLEGRDFCRSLEGRDFCLPVRLSEDCAVTGPRVGAWARLGRAGCSAGSQRLFGPGCCGSCSKLGGGVFPTPLSPSLPGAFAAGTDGLRVGDSHSLL